MLQLDRMEDAWWNQAKGLALAGTAIYLLRTVLRKRQRDGTRNRNGSRAIPSAQMIRLKVLGAGFGLGMGALIWRNAITLPRSFTEFFNVGSLRDWVSSPWSMASAWNDSITSLGDELVLYRSAKVLWGIATTVVPESFLQRYWVMLLPVGTAFVVSSAALGGRLLAEFIPMVAKIPAFVSRNLRLIRGLTLSSMCSVFIHDAVQLQQASFELMFLLSQLSILAGGFAWEDLTGRSVKPYLPSMLLGPLPFLSLIFGKNWLAYTLSLLGFWSTATASGLFPETSRVYDELFGMISLPVIASWTVSIASNDKIRVGVGLALALSSILLLFAPKSILTTLETELAEGINFCCDTLPTKILRTIDIAWKSFKWSVVDPICEQSSKFVARARVTIVDPIFQRGIQVGRTLKTVAAKCAKIVARVCRVVGDFLYQNAIAPLWSAAVRAGKIGQGMYGISKRALHHCFSICVWFTRDILWRRVVSPSVDLSIRTGRWLHDQIWTRCIRPLFERMAVPLLHAGSIGASINMASTVNVSMPVGEGLGIIVRCLMIVAGCQMALLTSVFRSPNPVDLDDAIFDFSMPLSQMGFWVSYSSCIWAMRPHGKFYGLPSFDVGNREMQHLGLVAAFACTAHTAVWVFNLVHSEEKLKRQTRQGQVGSEPRRYRLGKMAYVAANLQNLLFCAFSLVSLGVVAKHAFTTVLPSWDFRGLVLGYALLKHAQLSFKFHFGSLVERLENTGFMERVIGPIRRRWIGLSGLSCLIVGIGTASMGSPAHAFVGLTGGLLGMNWIGIQWPRLKVLRKPWAGYTFVFERSFHVAQPLACLWFSFLCALHAHDDAAFISWRFLWSSVASYSFACMGIWMLGDVLRVDGLGRLGRRAFDILGDATCALLEGLSEIANLWKAWGRFVKALGLNLLEGFAWFWKTLCVPVFRSTWGIIKFAWSNAILSWICSAALMGLLYKVNSLGWDERLMHLARDITNRFMVSKLEHGWHSTTEAFSIHTGGDYARAGAKLALSSMANWLLELEQGALLRSPSFLALVSFTSIGASFLRVHRQSSFIPSRVLFVPVLAVSASVLIAPSLTKLTLGTTLLWTVLSVTVHRYEHRLRVRAEQALRMHRMTRTQPQPNPSPRERQLRLDEVLQSLPPATEAHTVFEATECIICMEAIQPQLQQEHQQQTTTLLCGHQFHSDCVAAWLIEQQRCPLCREPVHRGQRIIQAIF